MKVQLPKWVARVCPYLIFNIPINKSKNSSFVSLKIFELTVFKRMRDIRYKEKSGLIFLNIVY